MNKKTTLNIFLAKFRKYFKIIFSEFSGVYCGPQSHGSKGPRGSKGTLGSKGLFGVIFLNSFCNKIKVLILPI